MIEIDAGDECDSVLEIDVRYALGPNQGRKRFREVLTEGPLSLHYIIGVRGAWEVRFYPKSLALAVEADCTRLYWLLLGRWKLMPMADFQHVHGFVDGMSALRAASTRAHRGRAGARGVRVLLVQGTQNCATSRSHGCCGGLFAAVESTNRRRCDGLGAPVCRGCGVARCGLEVLHQAGTGCGCGLDVCHLR